MSALRSRQVGLDKELVVPVPEPPEPPDTPRASQQLFTVFQGSSPEDVSHARQFWSSMSLLPPLESRLVSADIHQRLPVSRPQRRGSAAAGCRPPPLATPPELQDERRRYEAMADQRKEILALLRRQRELRIRKERLRDTVRPRMEEREVGGQWEEEEEEEEEEMVKQLQ